MFDPSIITDWAIKYKDLAVFIIFVVAFIEAFIITGTFWASLILLLTTTALYEIDANLTFMCIGAACGAFTGDTLSFYLGEFVLIFCLKLCKNDWRKVPFLISLAVSSLANL